MNAIDFVRESARFMCEDRPDVYNHSSAVNELWEVIDYLRSQPGPVDSYIFSSYVLMRITTDEGVEEFIFSRKLSACVFFSDDEVCAAYAYHDEIDLPGVLDSPEEAC